MADYKTVGAPSHDTIYEKKSEFIGYISHAKTEADAQSFLASIRKKHYDARHACYAYIIKDEKIERQSDDGEPQKTAGMPILALENQEGTISWDGDPSCFALRVRGDSMINAGILNGDMVVVRPQTTADDGQIVVARIEDEATVKRRQRRNGEIWLMPENDAYSPIDGSQAEIIGLVKAVVREY